MLINKITIYLTVLIFVSSCAKNPVSGMPHRAAMALPNGQDFLYAEVANGTTITKDSSILQLPNNTNTHSQLSRNKMNNHGMIKE